MDSRAWRATVHGVTYGLALEKPLYAFSLLPPYLPQDSPSFFSSVPRAPGSRLEIKKPYGL